MFILCRMYCGATWCQTKCGGRHALKRLDTGDYHKENFSARVAELVLTVLSLFVCFVFCLQILFFMKGVYHVSCNIPVKVNPGDLTLSQSCSCIEPSLAFATGTTSKHQRVT